MKKFNIELRRVFKAFKEFLKDCGKGASYALGN
ncbi:hypothetical protein BPT24_141 [Tenacibaculum phage pT24]|uniref:Uncharacterized protein n=1 Tax=Tenacibaculum phage pT24 TaxID=1880590 RepID=A0A1W7GKP3_9CAUD|nr:hypothetical protein HYP10_gp141 [Tenacibaculum phage pT24]BAX25555.1 hypothetical protein BPT24_141 [Tenacibaculum phage pT24]